MGTNYLEAGIEIPLIAEAWVVNYDPQFRQLFVILNDGQQLPYPVNVLFNGPADTFAVNQEEMPRIGTKGLILFPNRDNRNGVWIGSFYGNLNNSITSQSNAPFETYHAHWNGAFSLMDETGNYSSYFPDGTYFLISQNLTLPTTYRNIYDGTNARTTRTEFKLSERVATTPSPFNIYLKHVSGTEFKIDTSGNMAVSGVSGTTLSVTWNGTTLQIDGSGNVNITLNSGSTFNIGGSSDALALVSALVSAFNSHTHPVSGSATLVPSVQWTASTIESQLAKVSS